MSKKVKLKKTVSYIISTVWIPLMGIFCIAAFRSFLNENLFIPLWSYLKLGEGRALTGLVLLICFTMSLYGWNNYKKLYSKNLVRWYTFAWFLFIFFSYVDIWNFLSLFCKLSCWVCLLSAYPIGVGVHWIYVLITKLIKLIHSEKRPKVSSDAPIPLAIIDDNPIKAEKEDIFGYAAYAQRIACTIIHSSSKDSYSIGINAPWGSGKTSMLNLIKQHISKEEKCIVVDFNPRQSANVNFIQEDFLSAVCHALKKYHSGAASAFHDYMRELKVLSEDTPWAKVLSLVHMEDTSFSRDYIEDIIDTIGKRLVVIIDDLDRLTGDEIIEVLKLIDKNASFKRTFFISAYDKQYVNGVLKKFLGDTGNTDFTDKYFSLEIPLPERKAYRRVNYVWRQLCNAHDEGKIKAPQTEITETIKALWNQIDISLSTVRDIKRFIGQFLAVYLMVEDDVVLKDFLLIQLLRLKNYDAYRKLRSGQYFKYELFGSTYATNYVIKDENELKIEDQFVKTVLRMLFPTNSTCNTNDKQYGNRHLSWKRSFDYYFYGMESGHVDQRKLIPLAAEDISLEDFRKVVSVWKSDNEKMEVTDFVVERGGLVHSAEDFKSFIRLLVMARYFCETHMLYLTCGRMLVQSNLADNLEQFNQKDEHYKKVFMDLIQGKEWVLSSILLQDAIHIALNPGEELELIFDLKELQDIAKSQLQNVLNAFHANKASSEDVYEMLQANISDVYPDRKTIVPEAITLVKNDFVERPRLYFKDLFHHEICGKNGVKFVINEHMPIHSLFKDQSQFNNFLNEISERHESLKQITNYLSELYIYLEANKFKPAFHTTKGRNDNIKQGDYKTYSLILEGER